MLINKTTQAQQEWIDFIESYENWRMDNTPNIFKTKKEGNIFWLKSNGKQRIRVSETTVNFYEKEDGQELSITCNINSGFLPIKERLDWMLDRMLKERVRREERENG